MASVFVLFLVVTFLGQGWTMKCNSQCGSSPSNANTKNNDDDGSSLSSTLLDFNTVQAARVDLDAVGPGLPGSKIEMCSNNDVCWDCCSKDEECIMPCTAVNTTTGQPLDVTDQCVERGGSCLSSYCCLTITYDEMRAPGPPPVSDDTAKNKERKAGAPTGEKKEE